MLSRKKELNAAIYVTIFVLFIYRSQERKMIHLDKNNIYRRCKEKKNMILLCHEIITLSFTCRYKNVHLKPLRVKTYDEVWNIWINLPLCTIPTCFVVLNGKIV